MKHFAAVSDGIVQDVTAGSGDAPANRNGVRYIECPRWVSTGDRYENGTWLHADGSPFSDEEAQKVFSEPLELINHLSSSEIDALWDAAINPNPSLARGVARTAILAISAALEVHSRSPQTKALVDALVQAGILTADRARTVFEDPNVV